MRKTSYSMRTLRRRSAVTKAVSLQLEVLDLTDTGLGPKGGMAVAQLLQCTEALQELHLVGGVLVDTHQGLFGLMVALA